MPHVRLPVTSAASLQATSISSHARQLNLLSGIFGRGGERDLFANTSGRAKKVYDKYTREISASPKKV